MKDPRIRYHTQCSKCNITPITSVGVKLEFVVCDTCKEKMDEDLQYVLKYVENNTNMISSVVRYIEELEERLKNIKI